MVNWTTKLEVSVLFIVDLTDCVAAATPPACPVIDALNKRLNQLRRRKGAAAKVKDYGTARGVSTTAAATI